MSAHTLPAQAGTVAKQIGQLFDICLEAAREAREAFPKSADGQFHPQFDPAYRFLRAKKMREAGLPMSLLGKHAEPDPLRFTPVRGEAA